jgi:hypothetical protein
MPINMKWTPNNYKYCILYSFLPYPWENAKFLKSTMLLTHRSFYYSLWLFTAFSEVLGSSSSLLILCLYNVIFVLWVYQWMSLYLFLAHQGLLNSVSSLQEVGTSAHHHPYTIPYLIIKMFFPVKFSEGAYFLGSQPNVFRVPAVFTA